MKINEAKNKVLQGENLSKEELMSLWEENVEELCAAADEIRKHFCGNKFDLCTIINAKSGKCPEDCKYCAQSAHYNCGAEEYSLLDGDEIFETALANQKQGIERFSVVTSGKRLSKKDVAKVCEYYKDMSEKLSIKLCASHGLLDYDDFVMMKNAGIQRYHCNLETSKNNFENICTTHTFEEKIATIKAAQKAGLEVCSGGIIGLGETKEDRVDMICTLRELGIKSIPLNVIAPIKNTPFENNKIPSEEEVAQTAAIFRFAVPGGFIRMAGGRGTIADKGKKVFLSGSNAAISGDMLTTSGIDTKTDRALLENIGYKPFSKKGIFVTATGTDVGKTYVCGLLAKKINESGYKCGYYKAALSGAEELNGKVIAGDADFVFRTAGIKGEPNDSVSYIYKTAVSPHLAAKIEGNPVETDKVKADFEKAKEKYEVIVAEGSGGIICPIRLDDKKIMLEDIIKTLNLDCIIVADGGLGTINSTFLTWFYMKEKGIRVRGIILNSFIKGDTMHEDNKKRIEELTGVPVICTVEKNADDIDICADELLKYFGEIQ